MKYSITKRCTNCNKNKTIKDFYLRNKEKGWLSSWCKNCVKQHVLSFQKTPKQRTRIKKYWHTVKGKKIKQSANRKYLYGINKETFEKLLKESKGCCMICSSKKKGIGKGKNYLQIDHCHKTKKVRGILCSSCNLLLGQAKDKVDILKKAIVYLEGRVNNE